jgi:hypothetical protein
MFFDQIATKVPKFDRFKRAWLESGNLTPETMVRAYNLLDFQEALQQDLANLDRSSAFNAAVYVADQFARCIELPIALRRE